MTIRTFLDRVLNPEHFTFENDWNCHNILQLFSKWVCHIYRLLINVYMMPNTRHARLKSCTNHEQIRRGSETGGVCKLRSWGVFTLLPHILKYYLKIMQCVVMPLYHTCVFESVIIVQHPKCSVKFSVHPKCQYSRFSHIYKGGQLSRLLIWHSYQSYFETCTIST